ncbi:DUF5776 domain-containing protein [Apilactobacillus quenuiae]|uniref:DUF5776 domain-containing protein n=1 Tax=Apilactobacillus quenuiae TaxID=2008377 RepID=UPI000D01950C|nr:DUF5776 domain-containing protein [Apilactobacillus quenuiae]
MQYNKYNIKKINDKKIMRKVKKQWVILSISAFAALGTAAFEMLNPNDDAHADENTTYNIHSDGSLHQKLNTSVGRDVNSSELVGKSLKVQLNAGQTTNDSDKALVNWNNGTKDTTNNNSQYETTYSNSTQGFKDAMNKDQQNVVKSQNNNQPTNTNAGITSAGYQNGVQQYDQYRNVMNAGATDAYNGNNANSANQNSSQAKNYYNAAYNGSNDAKNAYNNATQNEGTNTNSYTSYNQWLAANNKDQTDTPNNNQSNVRGYQKSIDGSLNNSNNSSVQTNNGNIQVTNNSDSNLSVNQKNYQTKHNYADGSAYALAYQYGYNYFLANQGAADAKSGKWNSANSSNAAKTSYQPSGSNNPYDQAYLGAQAAINAQINQTQNGNNIAIGNYNGSGNSAIYQSAYNDVAKNTQSGIVYLGNATQMDNVLQNNMSNVNSLNLVNDIGYSDTNDNFSNYPQYSSHVYSNFLNINGQNHILDMTNNSYTLLPVKANTKINISNFKTLYGSNYYGPFALDNNSANSNNNTTSSLTYTNLNYVGSKLVSSYYSYVYINGNVNVDATDTYTSPFNQNITTQTDGFYGNGNYQENLQVNSMILGANSNYFGNTSLSSQSGGTVIQLQKPNSSLTLGKNSTMTLMPTGATSGENSPDNGQNAYGINMSDSNPTLNINAGATLNILPDTDYGNHVAGIYNSGTINVNGGIINTEANTSFDSESNQMIYSSGQVNVTNGGMINVKVSGLGNDNSDGLINNKNNINISNRGNLTVEDLDSGGGNVNLVGGNSVNVYNVGQQGATFITNGNAQSKFATGGINAYTVTAYTNPNNKTLNWYYSFKLNNNGQANYVDSNGNSSSYNINSNQLYIRSVPSVSFVGPVYTTTNNGVTTIRGYAKIDSYNSSAGQLYIQYASGNSNTYNYLTPFSGQNTTNQYSTIDTNKYYSSQNVDGINLIPLSFTVPSASNNANNYGIRLRYGVSGVNAVVTNNRGQQTYTANTEGYTVNPNKQLIETDAKSASGNTNSSSDGSSDGISDASTNNNATKDSTRYQKDLDYTNAYDNAKAGYQAYLNNPNNPAVPANSSDPSAYSQGSSQAQKEYQSAYKDSINSNNPSGQPDANATTAQKAGFAKGQEIVQGIADSNNNPGQGDAYQGSADQKSAYQAASAAIQAGMSNTSKPNDLSSQSQAYQDAYNKAYADAQQKAQAIANNGGKTAGINLTIAQQDAQDKAQSDMNQATIDAQAADGSKDNNYQGNTNADKTYQGAQAGYANGGTGKPASSDPVYRNAFNTAQAKAQAAASNGANQYIAGQSNNPTENTKAERNADNYGYQQAQQGYADAKATPNQINQDKYNNDPSYKAGVDMNTAVNNGISDANNANTKDPNYNNNHNAAQTAGYDGTFNGSQAGMNNDPKQPNLANQTQAYQDAYNQAYAAGKQLAAQIAAGKVDPTTLKPGQQAAYNNSPQAVQQATTLAAQNNPNNDSKYNGTDNASRAYQAAKAGYANGGTGSMTSNQQNDPIYKNAFDNAQTAARKAANQGAQNYINGSNTNTPNENTPSERAADDYGYQQAQKGYDEQRKGEATNNGSNPSYQAGVQMAEDVDNGAKMADQFTDNTYPGKQNDSQAQKDAYQATKAAYQAAMNGTGQSDNSSQSRAYRDAYATAYQDANNQINAINKGNITPDRLVPGQRVAYEQAQAAINSAINDAQNNPDTINDKYNGTDNASRAYQAAKAGYANAGNNNIDSKYADDPVYKKVFNQAKSDAQAQAAQAVKDFADGKDNHNQNDHTAFGKSYNQGYNEMQAGYKANPVDTLNNDPSYRAGVQMAKDVKAGTTDAYTNPKQGNNYQGSLAQQEAYQATVDANTAASSDGKMRDNLTNQPRAYQDAYKQTYEHAAQMTRDAAAGKINKNDLNNQLDRESYTQGINLSQKGYQAAQDNDPNTNDNKYHGQGISDLAYQGAKAGFNDGTKNVDTKSNNDPVYVNAYNTARDAARKYAKSGAQDFAQGTFKKGSDPDEHDDKNLKDALNQARDYGYQQAQNGYNDQQSQKDKDLTKNGNPEYDAGAKMARDSNLGAQFALNGTGTNPENSDIAQRDGYQATINGYQDGANGHKQKDLSGHSQAYKDAYNQAYENGQKLAQQGASGKQSNSNLLQNNVPGQKAYAQGITDANSGYQAAASQDNMNDDGNHNDVNSNTDKAYQGALAGFKDGGQGLNNPSNTDPVYVKAYQDANQVAQAAIQTGVNEFAHGDDSSSTNSQTNPISTAHNQGFDQAKSGYEAQLAGHADFTNHNPGYIAGVNMAKQYQAAINDTNNDPNQAGSTDPVSQATRAATLAGYSDSIHNIDNSKVVPAQYQNQSKVYQAAYAKARQAGIINTKAGAAAFNNNDVAPTGNDINSMAKEQGFAAARDAYKKAQENSTISQSNDGSNYSETYNGAANAFNNVLKGKYDEPDSSSDIYNSAYRKAMNEAKQLIHEAAINHINNDKGNGSSNLSTDTISRLSDLGMNDAAKAYQAAQDKENPYHSTDPNSIDVYNGAKAAFGDINNGHVNTSRNGNDLYNASYDQALKDAQSYAQKGADGYSNGKHITPPVNILGNLVNPTNAEIDALNAGYNQAKAGHDDAKNGVTKPKQNNPYYNNEFNAKADINTGTSAAMQDATKGNQDTGDNKLDQAYNGTVDAYKNAGKTARDISQKPIAYQDAYNKAKDDAQKNYQAGADQFNNNLANSQVNDKGARAIAYNNGYQEAQAAYNQVLNNPNVLPSSLTPAQQVGYDKAKQVIAGMNDYTNGKQPNSSDSNYSFGYNVAQQAATKALADVKADKPNAVTNDAILDINPNATKLYRDIYNDTYNGYQAGYNDQAAVKNASRAYLNAYQQGQADIVIPSYPASNNEPLKPNVNHLVKTAYNKSNQNDMNAGMRTALREMKPAKHRSSYYNQGYRNGIDGLAGMKAASNGLKLKAGHDDAYKTGYNGYKAGVRAAERTIKANQHMSKRDLAGKSKLYVYTFKQGMKHEERRQHNVGAIKGIKQAKSMHAIPASLSLTHSSAYVKSYVHAYKLMMKRHMPKYVYNIRTIFVHKQLRFTNKNRIVRYVKMPRYKAKLLKVTGIAYYKNGIPRYRVIGGGMIADKHGTGVIAANNSIVDAYYHHNFKTFRLIKPSGALVHTGKKFSNGNAVRKLYHGEIFKVDRVVKYHGLTRFYIGHGLYVTSNKTYVKKIG